MKILGHRGINQNEIGGKPYQNTIEAFNYALGFSDGIELDVFLSKDNICHIIHDDEIEKHSSFSSGRITELTSKEIEKLSIGKRQKYNIPKLSDVIEIIGKKILNIEIKQKGIQEEVLNEINSSNMNKENLILSSFNHDDLLKLRKKDKDIKIGILFSELKENSYEEYLIKLQKKIGNSIFIPNKECELERINNSEIVKYYWTFKQEDTLNKIKNYPNSNIISDFPEIYKNENQ